MNDSQGVPLTTMSRGVEIKTRFFPESQIDSFSRVDGTLLFYSKVNALLQPDDVVLDFGAGRGANVAECKSGFIRKLQVFRGRCAKVFGCDIDPVVMQNPYVDEARVQEIGAPIPFDDEVFDLIVSNWVFEHVEDAQGMADELLRVVKPGGWICARTPNKFGYIALASRMVANRNHARMLKNVQPDRKDFDVFPTVYRMNTMGALEKLFGARAEVLVFTSSSDPSYHFNKPFIYWAFKALHKVIPSALDTTLYIFIRKRP